MRTIEAVAILFHGIVWSVPRPGRHNDVIHKIVNEGAVPNVGAEWPQGFVTNDGKFVDRQHAKKIAREAGQLLKRASHSADLFSEDVW